MKSAYINKPFLLAVLVLTGLVSCRRIHREPAITVQELKRHVHFLASDELEGRYPGTQGDKKAAEYIRQEFAEAGLILPGEEGFQAFEILLDKKPAGDLYFRYDDYTAVQGTDFTPALFSSEGQLHAPVVFAGYGFDIKNGANPWNDYRNTDISGKWVMLLRGSPEPDNPAGRYASYDDDRDKVILARDREAGGVLLITGQQEDFPAGDPRQAEAGIPVLYITPAVANHMIRAGSDTLSLLKTKLDSLQKPLSFELAGKLEAGSGVEEIKAFTQNVVGYLEGSDPVLKNEVVVIGAHYDHLGLGGENSSSRKPDTTAVHYGADDNASGVAGILELAGRLAAIRDSLSRSYLFVAFGAEEHGLLGSRHFLEEEPVISGKYTAMINLDMIGRLNKKQNLQIGGIGSSVEADSLIGLLRENRSFDLALSAAGYGPSDHASFYSKDIPVFFFSTGPHLDYHTPFDTPDKLRYEEMREICGFIFDLLIHLDNMPHALTYREAGPKQGSAGRHAREVSLGIMPDFAGVVKNGLRADYVIEGRPADLAGMQDGDIITAVNGKPVMNIDDYMFRLSQLKPGQTVPVEIKRGDEVHVLLIQL
ncbi:MAG: M28 family peptidase [Bacteroidales bacterium]